jgi:hypothetical protein
VQPFIEAMEARGCLDAESIVLTTSEIVRDFHTSDRSIRRTLDPIGKRGRENTFTLASVLLTRWPRRKK